MKKQVEDLVIKFPMEINPKNIKMKGEQKEASYIFTIEVKGPFSEEESEIMEGLCSSMEIYYGDSSILSALN